MESLLLAIAATFTAGALGVATVAGIATTVTTSSAEAAVIEQTRLESDGKPAAPGTKLRPQPQSYGTR